MSILGQKKMIFLEEDVNFSGCSLAFPSVSVGNVGQLATDLLVTKLKPKKIGTIYHSAIMPMVGGDPYNFSESALTTSAEVFFSEECKLVIIQIRSPIIQESSNDFVSQLVKWAKENNIVKIIILTGVFDFTNRSDIGVGAKKIIAPAMISEECDLLEKIVNEQTTLKNVSLVKWNSNDKLEMHGGGISKRLFRECISQDVVPIIMMKYCSEGDNVADAKEMCALLNVMLKLVKVDPDCIWECPPSWGYMYGNLARSGLY